MTAPVSIERIGFLQHRPGDLIKNRYAVLQHLGGGNFGSVYLVRDSAVGNRLACKEMHVLDDPTTAQDERAAALDLFKREALNLATLRHPNIPAAYFEQEDGDWRICPRCGLDFPDARFCPEHGAALLPVPQRYYLMMDYIDGPTLEELAAGGPLDVSQSLAWTEQIAGALRGLHRVGIIHRDVKPENIKIRREDESAVLLDFGLTRKAHEAGGYGTVPLSGSGRFGTPGYAPPNPHELAHPERRSDIYALGMTLYRLVSGRNPQEAEALQEMLTHPPGYFNRDVTPPVEHLIVKATSPLAEDRYGDIDELLTDLTDLLRPLNQATVPPLIFADGSRARSPQELARLIETHTLEASNYLQNGMMTDWLRNAGFAAATQAAQDALRIYNDHPARALERVRRALLAHHARSAVVPAVSPAAPVLEVEPGELNFDAVPSGASTTRTLRLRNSGAGLIWGTLHAGDEMGGLRFEPEFEGNDIEIEVTLDTSRIPNGSYFGFLEIEVDAADEPRRKVPVSYQVLPLQLEVQPTGLDLGTIAIGDRVSAELRVVERANASDAANHLAGRPRGNIRRVGQLHGLEVTERFEGTEPFEVVVDATAPEAVARSYEGSLQFDTNGGRLNVPVHYTLFLPPRYIARLLVLSVLTGAGGALLLRLCYGILNPLYAWRWLAESGRIAPIEVSNFVPPVTFGALAGLIATVYWLTRPVGSGDGSQLSFFGFRPRDQRLQEPSLLQSLLLGVVFGTLLGWPFWWIMHWMVWGFLDWLLLPLSVSLAPLLRALGQNPQFSAPQVWALCGAIAGLAWSCERIVRIFGKQWLRYGLLGLVGVLLILMIVNAMLFTVG